MEMVAMRCFPAGARSRAIAVLAMFACVSCTEKTETDPITGRWRIVQISQDGRLIYQAGSSPVVIDLELDPGGSGRRITNQLAAGQSDTTAISYARTGADVTVTAPGEAPVTYACVLSEDANEVTFTAGQRILRLQRVRSSG
jgi:hypothetical protein